MSTNGKGDDKDKAKGEDKPRDWKAETAAALRAAGVRFYLHGDPVAPPVPGDADYEVYQAMLKTRQQVEEMAKQLHADDPPPPNGEDDYGTENANGKTTPLKRNKSLVAFPLVSFVNATLDAAHRGYLIKGLLPDRGLVVVWGPPKCYKSFWATDLALHIAFGWTYRGRRVRQVVVIYIALEGRHGLARRLAAFKQRHNVEESDAPFYLMTTPLILIKQGPAFLKDVEAQLAQQGVAAPGMFVIDTLNRSLVGSESKDEEMAAYIAAATLMEERFKCAVVIVHHCGVKEDRPRGHTSLTGAVEVQLKAERIGDLLSRVTLELAKDLPEGDEIISRLETVPLGTDEEGDPISSLIVLPADPAEMPAIKKELTKKLTKGQRALHNAATELFADGRTTMVTPRAGMAPVLAIKMADLKAEFERRYVVAETDQDAKRKALNRALGTFLKPPSQYAGGEVSGSDWIWRTT